MLVSYFSLNIILADPATLLVAIKENIGSFKVDENWTKMLNDRDCEKEVKNRCELVTGLIN